MRTFTTYPGRDALLRHTRVGAQFNDIPGSIAKIIVQFLIWTIRFLLNNKEFIFLLSLIHSCESIRWCAFEFSSSSNTSVVVSLGLSFMSGGGGVKQILIVIIIDIDEF